MTEEKDLIRIQWHVDRTGENPKYCLICLHPDHPDLHVEVEASEKMTERVAKAYLMQQMFNLSLVYNGISSGTNSRIKEHFPYILKPALNLVYEIF